MRRAALVVLLLARLADAVSLAESISVSGDSISRGFDANTSSCNYADNVPRNWATGNDHAAASARRAGSRSATPSVWSAPRAVPSPSSTTPTC